MRGLRLGFGLSTNVAALAAAGTPPANSPSYAVMSIAVGQSRLVGTNQLDDATLPIEHVSTRVKFANVSYINDTGLEQFLPQQIVKTSNTIDGVAGLKTEYQSSGGISHLSGVSYLALNDGSGYLPGVTDVLFFKNASSGTPQTTWAPGGGGFSQEDRILRLIGDGYVAANDTRVSDITYVQGSAEATTANSNAETSTGSTDWTVVVPAALADPVIADWGDLIHEQSRRAYREYAGDPTLPFIIIGYVLPAYSGSGAAWSNSTLYTEASQPTLARIREGVHREAMNLCRYVVTLASDGNSITVTDRGTNRWTTTFDTVNDKPIFTDSGVVDPRCDDNSYYLDIRGICAPPDGLHERADAQVRIGKMKVLLLEHIYGTGGIPPEANTLTRIKPIFFEPPAVVDSPGTTTVEVSLTPSETGTVHIAAYTAGSPAPTAAQVVAGTGTGLAVKQSKACSYRTEVTDTLTGLSGETGYDIYAVIDYDSGNYSVVSDALSVTTLAEPPPSTGPSFRSYSTGSCGATGSATPALPAGLADNDILVAFIETNDDVAPNLASGYTQVTGSPVQTGNNGNLSSNAATRLTIVWKRVADAASETAPSFPAASNHTFVTLMAFSGCVTSGDPFDVIESSNTDGSTNQVVSTLTSSALTTTVDNTLVVNAFAVGLDRIDPAASAWINTDLSSFGELSDDFTNLGGGGGILVAAGGKAVAGAVGASTATLTTPAGFAEMSFALVGA